MAQAQQPALSISWGPSGFARLSWPSNFTGWRLTSTTNLTLPGGWESVADTPQPQGDALVLLYATGDQARYFRLEAGGGCVFHATPTVISPGASSVLSWCPVSGTAYQLVPGPGTTSGSSYVVTPELTTTYSLLASNADGVTFSFVTVTVTSTNQPSCELAGVTNWDCTLSFSYEITPSTADYSFVIRREAHLTFQLTPLVVAPPILVEFAGYASGNAQVNDLMDDFTFVPARRTTLVGSGVPHKDPANPSSSRLVLDIDCTRRTYTFLVNVGVSAVLANPDGSTTDFFPVGLINVRNRPLPAGGRSISGSEFISSRSPLWTGGGDYYRAGPVLGDLMFFNEAVNDNTAGSASVNWSFTPHP